MILGFFYSQLINLTRVKLTILGKSTVLMVLSVGIWELTFSMFYRQMKVHNLSIKGLDSNVPY
jgi:hypothetical protein